MRALSISPYFLGKLVLTMGSTIKSIMPDFFRVRSEDLIISASLTQDFCSSSRRRNRRIAGYATVSTTQKTDKKTSQEPDIIKSSLLSN